MKTMMVTAALAIGLAAPAQAQMMGRGDPLATFKQADSNGDGLISRAEFAAARSARFAQMDRNGDGVVSNDDFGRIAQFRPEAGKRLATLIAQADANGNGKVTKAEFEMSPMPIFDLIDANRDGKVDKAELAAGRERIAELKAMKDGAN